jgi:hypothetical protein
MLQASCHQIIVQTNNTCWTSTVGHFSGVLTDVTHDSHCDLSTADMNLHDCICVCVCVGGGGGGVVFFFWGGVGGGGVNLQKHTIFLFYPHTILPFFDRIRSR